MAKGQEHHEDAALDRLFAGARRARPAPDAEFLARLDADMEASLPLKALPETGPQTHAGFLRRFRGVFAASGLTGAAALGVWIGFVMPETLNVWAPGYEASDAIGIGAFLPHADLAALEE